MRLPSASELPSDPALADMTDREFGWVALNHYDSHEDAAIRAEYEGLVESATLTPVNICGDANVRDLLVAALNQDWCEVFISAAPRENGIPLYWVWLSCGQFELYQAYSRSCGRALCIASLRRAGVEIADDEPGQSVSLESQVHVSTDHPERADGLSGA